VYPIIEIDNFSSDSENILAGVISHCYDIEKDDAALRRITSIDSAGQGIFFKRLRSNYDFRHEFSNFTVRIKGKGGALSETLDSFGFKINSEDAG
jgi:hypothetical protein